jgi:hypothetical protein
VSGRDRGEARPLRLELPVSSIDDARTLRGALLAARAAELSELRRRAGRLSLGYGSESARESMDAETDRHRRRIELLDELIEAMAAAVGQATNDSD